MPLDHAAAKLATDWINQKAPLLRCQGCGSDQWNLGELAAAISVPNHAPGPCISLWGLAGQACRVRRRNFCFRLLAAFAALPSSSRPS